MSEPNTAAVGPGVEEDDAIADDKYLTFELGAESYGIEIQHVREIIGIQPVTTIPDVPAWICGVINLRGKVIPVASARRRFGLPDREADARTCIIVVDVEQDWFGLVVDTVSEVLDITPDLIQPPPPVFQAAKDHFLSGVGKTGDQVRLLLDAPRMFAHSDARVSA